MFYNNYKELFYEDNKNPFDDQLGKLAGFKMSKKFKSPPKYKTIFENNELDNILGTLNNNKKENKIYPKSSYTNNHNKQNNYNMILNNNNTLKKYEKYTNPLNNIKNNIITNPIINPIKNIKIKENEYRKKIDPLKNASDIILKDYSNLNEKSIFDNKNTNNYNKYNLHKNKITYDFINKDNNKEEKNSKNFPKNYSLNVKNVFDSMDIYNHKDINKSKYKNEVILYNRKDKIKLLKILISKIIPDHLFDKFMVENILNDNTTSNLMKALNRRVEEKINNDIKKNKLKKLIN